MDPPWSRHSSPGELCQVRASVALTQPGAAEPRSSVCIKTWGGDESIPITASPLSLCLAQPCPELKARSAPSPTSLFLETCPDSRGMKDGFRVSSDSCPGTGTERFVFLSSGQTTFHLLGKTQTLATWGDFFFLELSIIKKVTTQEFLQRLNTCSHAKKNKLGDLLNTAACYHLWQHRECACELRDVAEVWEQSQCSKITGFLWSCSCRWKKMSFCKCQHKETVPSVTAVTYM